MKELIKVLRECSKDEDSFLKLPELFRSLEESADTWKRYLELLERVVRNDYDSILITDLNLDEPGPKIVYVNDGFTRMTGYTREEVIGLTPRILQGEKTDRAVLDRLRDRLSRGEPFFGHTVNYRKDGSEFVNQWDIHPLTDDSGEITHWVSYQHDITERKRSEKSLIDTEVEFDNLHEEAKSTKVDLDENGAILSANRSFRELIGYEGEELRGMAFRDLLAKGNGDSFGELFDPLKQEELEEKVHDLTLASRKGDEIEVFAAGRVLSSDGRRVVRLKLGNRSLQRRIVKMLQTRTRFDELLNKKMDFGYKVYQLEGEYCYAWISESFCNITGISEEQVRDRPVREMVAEEDWPKVRKHF